MGFSVEDVDSKEKIEYLAAMANEIWHEHFPGIISVEQIDYMVEKFQSVGAITGQLSDGYFYKFILLDGERVGFIGAHPENGELFLSKLYLKKAYRGKGLGRAGLEYLEEYCRENGLSKIWLTCNIHNGGSIAVYEKCGYKNVRSQVADIGRGYVMDDYIFEKII